MKIRPFPVERQLDAMDCGAACLKIIAKHYGKFYSLQYLRDKCGTTREGVSLMDLSYAAETIGLRSIAVSSTIDELRDKMLFPCILHLNNNHFVVAYKVTQDSVYVSDPARGLLSYSYPDLKSLWYLSDTDTGIAMAIEPMADFKQRETDERIERKKTFQNFFRVL